MNQDEPHGPAAVHDRQARYTLDDLHGVDAAMRRCLDLARVAARTELPILILGESGTGKTMLARAIHNSSRRASASFVAFNAAALSDTLLDSQLFGHERGAFTGASRRVKGKFELADGGTLFIDEIADMTPAAQAKILRAVEYGEFERLGSESLQRADVRLMSATHLPLLSFAEGDHFRRDLFYRVTGLTVTLPALRDRPHDLRALIAAETAAASRAQGKAIIGLSKAAADLLLSHGWPGNVRELKRVIHSAVAMTDGELIPEDAIILDRAMITVAAGESDATVAGAAGGHKITDSDIEDGSRGPQAGDDLKLSTIELKHIRWVLDRMGGNKRRAARVLGLSRSTLDRKLAVARSAAQALVSAPQSLGVLQRNEAMV